MGNLKKIIKTWSVSSSPGQTLIETIVGLGLLTTGIIGGMSLAVYALGASDYSLKQIVATNLAREGVEVVRNMRDTNWLQDTLDSSGNSCHIDNGQACYRNWDTQAYDISGSSGGTDYAVRLLGTYFWGIDQIYLACQNRVYQDSDGSYYQPWPLLWFCIPVPSGSGGDTSNQYYRRVRIIRDTNNGFSALNPRLLVRSTVWWKGKRCPAASDNPPTGTNCKVMVEEYLTNWKNY
jgi:hypothetical protein